MSVFDLGGNIGRGMQLGQGMQAIRKQNELANLYQQHGAGLASGQAGAINALAAVDPAQAADFRNNAQSYGIRGAENERAAQRHGMAMQIDRLQVEKIKAQAAQLARAESATADATALDAERRETLGAAVVLRGALQSGPEAFEALKQQYADVLRKNQIDPASLTFEQAPYLLAALVGTIEGLGAGSAYYDSIQGGGQESYRQITGDDAASMGLDPNKAYNVGPDGKVAAIGGGGITVNTGSEVGAIPQGYEMLVDPETGARRLQPIAGGPKDTSPSDARRQGARDTATETVVTSAMRALDASSKRVLGGALGALAAFNPGSQNAEVYRQIDILGGMASVQALQQMREASPTGGALGSVTERELAMLKNQSGVLDPASPNFERDLMDYTRTLLRTIHGTDAGDRIFNGAMLGRQPAPAQAPAQNPVQLPSVPDFGAMSDEELDAYIRQMGGQ